MGQRLLQRRLAQASARMREIREELSVVEDQLAVLADDADDKSLRALVSETAAAEHDYREANRHAEAMRRHRDGLVAELDDLTLRMNDLLDRMEPTA